MSRTAGWPMQARFFVNGG